MRELPRPARTYIVAVVIAGAVVLARAILGIDLDNPYLFVALLLLSNVSSAFKVALPLSASGSTMSVSYAVDFASLLLLGPAQTTVIAVTSAWSQCTFRMRQPTSTYRTLFSMACLAVTVQAAGWVYLRLGGVPGAIGEPLAGEVAAAGRRGDDLFPLQHRPHLGGDRPLHPAALDLDLERELPVERAELLRRGRRGVLHRRIGAAVRPLVRGADGRAAVPDLPHLQGLSGAHRRRTAPRAGDVGPASGDHRSAGAGDRRQGSDRAEPHPPRPGLRRRHRPRPRDAGQRDPGREDRRAAARHRQAGGARTHPVEARTAHPGGVPEDPRSTRRSAPRSSARCRSPIRSRRSSSAITNAGTARAIRRD